MTTLFLQITFLIANLFFVGISYDIASSKQFDINNISLEAELSTELGEEDETEKYALARSSSPSLNPIPFINQDVSRALLLSNTALRSIRAPPVS